MLAALTIEEIAELAEVSRSTVSRVLNNHPSVRPLVRERVLQVMQQHHYAPRAAARSLASSRTNVIGLLIPRSAAFIFADPFFPIVIQGISEACSSRGYFLMLAMLTAETEQGFYDRILRGRHFDGLIVASSDIDDPILPLLMRDHAPLVLVGSHPYLQNLAWVDVDNREGAHKAVTHLIELGHRRIATIAGPSQMAAGIERRNGYKQALLEAGIPITPELMVTGDFSQEGGYLAMQHVLALPQRPGAIFVASDTMAIGALRAIHEAGVAVPEEIAIVGFDDLPSSVFANPPLTTIHQPIAELGVAAVKLLIDQFERPEAVTHHVSLPTQLIIRSSCGATAGPKGKGG
jgi:LacI family transcriptional regulator